MKKNTEDLLSILVIGAATFLFFLGIIALAALLFKGFWALALVPFGVPAISFWQSFGLLMLLSWLGRLLRPSNKEDNNV